MTKYGAKKTAVNGITFDSKRESQRYQELCLLQRGGVIADLELQPKFELQPAFRDSDGRKHRAIYYIADFAYDEPGCDRRIVEDVKGYAKNKVWLLKQKLFLFTHPDYELRIVK